jgi:hypothetical protein
MPYLVFSQATELQIDAFSLVHKARRFFEAELAITEQKYRGEGVEAQGHIELGLTLRGRTAPIVMTALVRRTVPADLEAAARAEQAGRAGGMALLARRCPWVWALDEAPGHLEEMHVVCAILAATLLGPVMPPDESTLYGVRGARERAERSGPG